MEQRSLARLVIVHIIINSIGKASNPWQQQALSTYSKRIKGFTTFTEHCNPTPKRQKTASITHLQVKEHALLTDNIPSHAYIIALDERGRTFSTQAFSEHLSSIQSHTSSIYFLLGGPDGLHPKTRQGAHLILSLSQFTLPHIFAKIMLYEQLYRCLTVMNNHPYHR